MPRRTRIPKKPKLNVSPQSEVEEYDPCFPSFETSKFTPDIPKISRLLTEIQGYLTALKEQGKI